MDLNNIHISISGIDYSVDMSFFERLDIIQEELIGDTYFIMSKDRDGKFQISVYKKIWESAKREIKIKKIFE